MEWSDHEEQAAYPPTRVPYTNLISILLFGASLLITTSTQAASFSSIQFNQENGEFILSWEANSGEPYQLQQSDDLQEWSTIAEVTTTQYVVKPAEEAQTQRFFRLLEGPSAQPRNVLLIIVDDWGIDSSPIDQTGTQNLPLMPNLEGLAASGIRFQSAYALPMCSPTRATILTGRLPFRHGIGSPARATLPENEITLPELLLTQSNYAVGSVGKWHLGGGAEGPQQLGGWPYYAGNLDAGLDDYFEWDKVIHEQGSSARTVLENDYATTVTTDDAIDWITRQGDTPWFCWVGYNAAHSSFHSPPNTVAGQANPSPNARGLRARYEAMLWAMDAEIGRLLESIDRKQTNVILIGDNGTPGRVIQPPYDSSHAKGTLYEGGTRVPLVLSGPDIDQTLSVRANPVHCADLFPTILELAGISPTSLNHTIDGVSLIAEGSPSTQNDRPIVCEAFGRSIDRPGRAIRRGSYKLIIYDDPTSTTDVPTMEMFALNDDPNEGTNLLDGPLSSELIEVKNQLLNDNQALGGNFQSPSE